ncbi:probable E3 ubiquitin-protein ligase makorin-2 [Anopheles stephensi]|uniref:probable E3 ubiquitin-protein ligase makorin-2 n=1 Tax=Anopheles stephensi TaxID=30069 RepID=UPI0016589EC0|nr:probable E3 ubiquitin-protein ligase makorin-2 [Anopheles stephensi]
MMEDTDESAGPSGVTSNEQIKDTPHQEDDDCVLDTSRAPPEPSGPDQRDDEEGLNTDTLEDSNGIEQENRTDEEDQEEDDEEGAFGISLSSSSSSSFVSYLCEDDVEYEPGDLRPCSVDDPDCPYAECDVHKELCDICHTYCLEPDDSEQRRFHRIRCKKDNFFERQYAIAVEQSCDKVCGICMELVMDKRPREQRFGILPKCMHVFCLKCIRNWRKVSTLNPAVRRGCPMCRVVSYFVCPSFVWVENKKAKRKLIADYKRSCRSIPCKYLQECRGPCPFGRGCFYQHTRNGTN